MYLCWGKITTSYAGAGERAQWLGAIVTHAGDSAQHLHGASQLSLTPVPGDLMFSSGFCEHLWTHGEFTCKQITHIKNVLKSYI